MTTAGVQTLGGDAAAAPCEILTLVLSWGRPDLLQRTVVSLREHTVSNQRIVVIDNNSDRATVDQIRGFVDAGLVDSATLLDENLGGAAFNSALTQVRAPFVHFSENDLEYRPGWDRELIDKFVELPTLGQLSPLAAIPEYERGEIWVDHPGQILNLAGGFVTLSPSNIGTTCLVRSQLVDRGLRWRTLTSGRFRWPDDSSFSAAVRELGYLVAWNDRYLATNWGHNIAEWSSDPEYYIQSHASKSWVGVAGMDARLAACGHRGWREQGPRRPLG